MERRDFFRLLGAVLALLWGLRLPVLADGRDNEGQKGPKIRFLKTTVDVGKVKKGEKAVYDFEFVNEGDSPLKILNLIPACLACTTATVDREEVPPGGKGRVTVTVDTGVEVVLPGKMVKAVEVRTNDPANRVVVLIMSGEVVE